MEARKSTGRSRTPAYSTEWSRLQLRRGETQDPNRQQAKQATSMSANKGNGDEEGADVTAPPRCASAAPPPRRASAAQACSPRLPDPLPADAPLPGAQPRQRERREEGRRAALAGTRRAVGGRRATRRADKNGMSATTFAPWARQRRLRRYNNGTPSSELTGSTAMGKRRPRDRCEKKTAMRAAAAALKSKRRRCPTRRENGSKV